MGRTMTHKDSDLLNLEDMNLFIQVVEFGGFSAAAQRLDIPKSTLSRRLRNLEDQLGTRLLERTTRSQHLTELGEEFYQRALLILKEVEATRQQISCKQDIPSGLLRVFAPSEFYGQHFHDIMPKFALAYPDVKLELFSGAGHMDMLNDKIDVMLYVSAPADSSYIARKITEVAVNFYASPSYLEQHGIPQHPSELVNHRCIVEAPNPSTTTYPWQYRENRKIHNLPIKAYHQVDSSYICTSMVEFGIGISMLPDFVSRSALERGSLIKLFDGRYQMTQNLYAVYSSRRYLPSKVRAFLSFLTEKVDDVM